MINIDPKYNEIRLETLLNINDMVNATFKELIEYAIDGAIKLTDSKIGYLATVNEGDGILTMIAWSETAMKECAIDNKPIKYFLEKTGLWGEAVRQRKPVITNDYAAPNEFKKGHPEGHVKVIRHMNIPLFEGQEVIAVIGVGNKEEDYNEYDILNLTLFMHSVWRILKRKEAEKELLKERDYSQKIIKYSPTIISGISPDGIISFLNPAAEKYTGHMIEDLIGKNWIDFFTHNSDKKILEDLLLKLENSNSGAFETTLVTKTGNVRLISWNYIGEFDQENKLTEILIFGNDITEKKLVEESKKELEQSNKELEQFAYIASHDLQEPLRVITSYVQLLEKRYKGKLDQDADDFINYAVDGAKRMKILINDLLTFSRFGTRTIQFVSIDTNAIVDQAIGNIKASVEESKACITRDQLPVINVDLTQMIQLFQNLIINSIKFRSEKTPHIHISAKQINNYWEFSIKDNGIGISKEYHEKIFAIFQRLNSKNKYDGTGIGLAICKKILDRHHGKIWVESDLKKGSTFYFTIPV